jgi:hypothetical protein
MLEREAAFWLVSEMFIFISVKMPQNRGWSFAASLSNMHPCNNVRVSGGIARGENDIDSHRSSKYTISNDFIF